MKTTWIGVSLMLGLSVPLAACSDDDDDNSNDTSIAAGDTRCYQGGEVADPATNNGLDFTCTATSLDDTKNFVRIASFPVCSQLDADCNTDEETAAEIVDVSTDGQTLVYSDSPGGRIGFIDITTPSAPVAAGVLDVDGEPTAVAVLGSHVLVGVNTSDGDFVNPSGNLTVVDVASQAIVTTIDLGGQPDSVAVSPDGNYAVIAIENERNEDEGDGRVGQAPGGFVSVVDTSDADPTNWVATTIVVDGLADIAGDDPEPEYVDINSENVAVVTLQENNYVVLIDLAAGTVTNSFTAGSADLAAVDMTEESPAQILQTESATGVPREPDGVTWINDDFFATADEGDMDGGSRGFTIFNTNGEVVWTAGDTLDHLAARMGHYPDARSENKGNEPENVEVGIFGAQRFLFVNSERSSLIFVYNAADPTNPVYKQTLPAAAGPEGVKAIPSRNLLVAASEEDARDDKLRSVVNIYEYAEQASAYPTLVSENRADDTPIPFAALSGLAGDPTMDDVLYSIEDSFFGANRIFQLDVSQTPARLVAEIQIQDTDGVLAGLTTASTTEDAALFDDVDLAAMLNEDGSVNLDPEGIAVASDGGFWLASEGAGTLSDTENRPLNSLNLILKLDHTGVISQVITLPEEVNALQVRFGFEGITEYDGKLYVAIQRAWEGEEAPRIGIYDLTAETWSFVFYPLDAVASQYGGWVGLSDITSLGDGTFLVLERDNQGGPDAAIKRIYTVDMSAVTDGETLTKTLTMDLMDVLKAAGGLVPEKIEGLGLTAANDMYIVNDNDGVDDNSGEIQLLKVSQ